MLAHELKEILKETGEVLDDSEIIEEVYNFEKLLKFGKVDFTKTILYALWAFNRISDQGVVACVGVDGYRIYSVPNNFPVELANRLLSLVCTLLKHQNELKNNMTVL